jgi:hypothetical protein
MAMRKILFLSLLLACFPIVCRGLDKPPAPGTLLWCSADVRSGAFIPESLLPGVLAGKEEARPPAARVSADVRQHILDEVEGIANAVRERRKKFQDSRLQCSMLSSEYSSALSPVRGRRISDLVKKAPISVLGKVVRTETGILYGYMAVSTLAEIRVEEALTDSTKSIHPGDSVVIILFGGSIKTEAIDICSQSDGDYLPRTGDRILVTAGPAGSCIFPGAIDLFSRFLIQDDRAVPDSRAQLADTTPVPLAEIRAAIAGGGAQ